MIQSIACSKLAVPVKCSALVALDHRYASEEGAEKKLKMQCMQKWTPSIAMSVSPCSLENIQCNHPFKNLD